MKPREVLSAIILLISLFLIFSGSYMLFFPKNLPALIQSPWKEIIGFFIVLLGLWILFKGP